ncbi:HAMP domain-containing histidine kinase [Facklamia sp. DSM 111018]|uniref:histidine kinase n=1 Tax=Facklamia lactis TaxID=2749967 RepID=A0ABS0LSC0_9LACT|nr:HAMP domain-containing sensor histidine kinase [Facklamia lactis]MBG9986904.1 HAMP domain-containing histidine kinase [Facklamia lactis]
MGKKSLNRVFVYFSFKLFVLTILLLLCLGLITNYAIRNQIIYVANYPEQIVEELRQKPVLLEEDLKDLPDYIQSQQWTENLDIQAPFQEKDRDHLKEAAITGRSISTSIFQNRVYQRVMVEDGVYIVSYQLVSDFTSSRLRQWLPNAEFCLLIMGILIWLVGFALVVLSSVRQIKQELVRLNRANQQVKELNLEKPFEGSNLKEIDQILRSMDHMRQSLLHTLKEQWHMQQRQKVRLQSLNHDIRTPLALIKGNLDLLKEETNEGSEEIIEDLAIGVERLQSVLDLIADEEKLEKSKEVLNQEVIDQWIRLGQSIAKKKNIQIKLFDRDSYPVPISLDALTSVLQNILSNAVDFAPVESVITLSFERLADYFRISISDQGPGFKEEDLKSLLMTKYTGRENKTDHQGLGLYVSNKIVGEYKGEMLLENRIGESGIEGAKVTILLPMNLVSDSITDEKR